MAFFKKVLKKITGKWYPEVVIVGRTVKLQGIGTFYYTIVATGMGQSKAEDVKASQIENVRVRFIPETTRTASNKVATRSMVNQKIWWEEWKGEEKKKPTP